MNNRNTLPNFSSIDPATVEPAIDALLEANRQSIAKLTSNANPDWESLIEPLELLDHRLSREWSPISHLNAVRNDGELRQVYNRCLNKLSDYGTELSQNEKLYAAFTRVLENESDTLTGAQHRLLELALRDFRLSGVALPANQKKTFRSLLNKLSALQAKFEENLLDCTNAWSYQTDDKSELAGLPQRSQQHAAELAQRKKQSGWSFLLDYPTYHAVISHADSEPLRKRFYTAWVTRASAAGPHDSKYDNTPVMRQILDLRHQAAQLVGFDNYAEYSLASKMASSVEHVRDFLEDLADRSIEAAEEDFDELEAFAGRKLNAWDVSYFSEKHRREKFDISDELLRPYFPVDRVISGMFELVHRMYGLKIQERTGVDTWHEDVRFFEVNKQDGTHRGSFYMDLYARESKRGGAWMDDCIGRLRSNTDNADPVAFLSCNFMPAVGDAPALLTHDEVVTLFHEFGHVLHHILTQVDHPSVAGINGVAWDAVELPSQFMENFCWTFETLPMFSGHYQTNESLPEDLFDRLSGSRTFQAGMLMVRQLEFALFDLRIHAEYNPQTGARIKEILDEVREQVAVVPAPEFNQFANGFAHVFGGGYAAGYYSYKWAEVLSADAFSAFEDDNIVDGPTGMRFAECILERGGAVDPLEAFVEFRGREPQLDALLHACGIA